MGVNMSKHGIKTLQELYWLIEKLLKESGNKRIVVKQAEGVYSSFGLFEKDNFFYIEEL